MTRLKHLTALVVSGIAALLMASGAARADNPAIYLPDPVLIPCALSPQKIRSVINDEVGDRDWVPRDVDERTIEARLQKDEHVVIVTISFDAREVHIRYRDSENMEYRGSGATATIKSGYNRWVRNIEKDIAVGISRSCS